jgi:hypothetical protein
MNARPYAAAAALLLGILLIAALTAVKGDANPPPRTAQPANPELLGVVSFGRWMTAGNTLVGGLSGITYDVERDLYLVLSDDRGRYAVPRAYAVAIDLQDGRLDEGDVLFQEVIPLRDALGVPYALNKLDAEGIAWAGPDALFIASEGISEPEPALDPFVSRFNGRGRQTRLLPLPEKFLPDGRARRGVRENLAFESLAVTPDRQTLLAASENALQQDGPAASLTRQSPARLLTFDLATGEAGAEFVYMVEPIAKWPLLPGPLTTNGLVDVQALADEGTFLALERSYALGRGNTVRVFAIDTALATDVSGVPALMGTAYAPVSKELLFDFEADLGIVPQNIEGMVLGPRLADGRQVLLFVSDNNFSVLQETQFVAVAVDLSARD